MVIWKPVASAPDPARGSVVAPDSCKLGRRTLGNERKWHRVPTMDEVRSERFAMNVELTMVIRL